MPGGSCSNGAVDIMCYNVSMTHRESMMRFYLLLTALLLLAACAVALGAG